jgi:hypothetical protein
MPASPPWSSRRHFAAPKGPLEPRAEDYCSKLNDCEDSSESEGGKDGAKQRDGGERERE